MTPDVVKEVATCPRWALLGAPLDSSATNRGEEQAPSALRSAGLVDGLRIDDRGDVHAPLTDTNRDTSTSIIAYSQLRLACEQLRDRVREVLADGFRPLIIGGDCSILVGALAGIRLSNARVGLAFVDGDLDCLDGSTSSTGECADMDLAIAYGHGATGLVDLAGDPPTVSPSDVIAIGYRVSDGLEESLIDERVRKFGAEELRRRGPVVTAMDIAEWVRRVGVYWVHLDVDVLDENVFPAVTYRQTGGLDWEELGALLVPLVSQRGLIGLSVADLVPPLDPTGVYTRRLSDFLINLLSV